MDHISNCLTEDQRRLLVQDSALLSKYGGDLSQWPEDIVRAEVTKKLRIPWIEAAPAFVDVALFRTHVAACRELGFLPTYAGQISMHVLMSEPFHAPAIRRLRNLFHREIHPVGTGRRALERTLSWLESSLPPLPSGIETATTKQETELLSWNYHPSEGVAFIERLLEEAYQRKASDVFLESYPDRLDIRFKGGAGCMVMPPIIQRHASKVLEDAKAFSAMSTRESRGYRDGSAEMRMSDGNVINFRVVAQRAVSGETMTLRLLDKQVVTSLSRSLPFPPHYNRLMRDLLSQKSGIIIVCGPTGSGKTTTLWRCLLSLDSSEKRIMTIEDPVEYRFDQFVQLQVKGGAESKDDDFPETFSGAFRSCLRAAPDIVLVGEMRDSETAQIAIQASLSGHLIFSTLHTPNSIGAIPRLFNLGVDALNIRQTLSAVVSQRLAPKLCPSCRIAEKPNAKQIHHYEFYGLPVPDRLYRPCGCPMCRETGYAGREPVFEILIISPELRALIKSAFNEVEMEKIWMNQGGETLAMYALGLAAKGLVAYEFARSMDGAWIYHKADDELPAEKTGT